MLEKLFETVHSWVGLMLSARLSQADRNGIATPATAASCAAAVCQRRPSVPAHHPPEHNRLFVAQPAPVVVAHGQRASVGSDLLAKRGIVQ